MFGDMIILDACYVHSVCSASLGVLPGIMASGIISICSTLSIPYQHKAYAISGIPHIDEMFVTNAVRGIQSISTITYRQHRYHDSQYVTHILSSKTPITDRIRMALQADIDADEPRMLPQHASHL